MKAEGDGDSRSILLYNIGQLLTLRGTTLKPGARRGADLSELAMIEDAAVLCMAGKIVCVGKTRDAVRDRWLKKSKNKNTEIDCAKKVVLPGFVDAHTHPAFLSPRLIDFEKRIAGATYEEIAKAGGGIRSSAAGVRKASQGIIAEKIQRALEEMAGHGTTTAEAKSGYGLTAASELKSLHAIRDSASRWPGTVVATLLGAHVLPQEFRNRQDAYVDMVCNQMIPQAAEGKLAQFVDVFTERGAFTLRETERIFAAAKKHALGVRAHVCQLTSQELRTLLRFDPASLDHLDHVTDDDMKRLALTDTVATLVPGANYFLGLSDFPPARKLIDAGVAVALATDYNPGSSPTASMPFVLSLACTHMKMNPAESIVAATLNGAWSLRVQERKGSIEPGKDADIVAFDVDDYREIPYWFGSNRVAFTILNGFLQRHTDKLPASAKHI